MTNPTQYTRIQGAGFSLRSHYFSDFLHSQPDIAWLEILADQFIGTQGIALEKALAICKDYPTTLHSVSLNIAGTDPLDKTYLNQLKNLVNQLNPVYVSDHCCWVAYAKQHTHDLLPFPFTQAAIDFIIPRIKTVQNYLQKPLLLENLSHYTHLNHDQSEADFLNQLCEKTGCGILLDINNVYVSSQNKGFNPIDFLESLNPATIKQCHLAGHVSTPLRFIDTHSQAISREVWDLYHHALSLFGAVPTCLEWDNDLPAWSVCVEEIKKIKSCLDQTTESVKTLETAFSKKIIIKSAPPKLSLFQKENIQTLFQLESLPASNGWSIHQNSSRISRIKALNQIFSPLEKWLGEAYWEQVCLKYIVTHPSNSPDITQGLRHFSDFLAQEIGESCHPLVDLTRYLWAWYFTFHKPSLKEGSLELLYASLNQTTEDIYFQLSPCVEVFNCYYQADLLWKAGQSEHKGPDPLETLRTLCLNHSSYLFFQKDQQVHTLMIDKADSNGLQLLKNPITLDKYSKLAKKIKNLKPGAFAQWYAHGWINIKVENEASFNHISSALW
jgi:uncharacterized protein (UPF0276 family)